jgi:hypothetical protein
MTPTTDDVAELVAELRSFIVDDPSYGECLRMSIDVTHVKRTIALIKSQAKALREAEADAKYWKKSAERAWLETQERNASMRAAEARLKEAEKVIELTIAYDDLLLKFRGPAIIFDGDAVEIDAAYDEWVRAARAFLNAGEK